MDSPMLEFEAIGTQWRIDIDGGSPEALSSLGKKLMDRIGLFDKAYSRFRGDSLVAEMARKPGTYELPADAEPMMSLYEKLYRVTDGHITPLIGQAISDAGYDAGYSLVERPMAPPPAWEEAISYSHPRLTLKSAALLDFGALGKGLLIDIVSGIVREEGFEAFCADAGGDMLRSDPRGSFLRVGLEDPGNEKKAIGIALISNGALCGSAGNRRAWGRFHHILNPKTLESPRDIVATWATAKTALLADAMATSLFFTERQKLQREFEFESLVLYADYSTDRSDGFQAELFA